MRLFVAVNLPDPIRQEIWESARLLRDRRFPIRWVTSEAMHITLKFLGEVSAHREDSVRESLEAAAAGVPPFVMRIGGFGAFPDPRRAKVIWVGCSPAPLLEQLSHQVDECMGAVGFARETRAFHPHVTLGRVRREATPSRLTGLPGMFDRLEVEGEFPVKSIDLMQSELSPAGAKYTVRASIGLTR